MQEAAACFTPPFAFLFTSLHLLSSLRAPLSNANMFTDHFMSLLHPSTAVSCAWAIMWLCDKVNFFRFCCKPELLQFLNSKQSPPPPPPLVPSPCRNSLRWIRRGVWLTSVMRWSPDRSWPSAAPPALSSTPNWNATRTRRPGVFWDSGQPVWGQRFLFLTLLWINLQLERPNKCLIYSLRYISTWKLLF